VEVVLAARGVPRPGARPEGRHRAAGDVRPLGRVGPDVPVGPGVRAVLARLPEPRVLDGGVVDDEVEEEAHAPRVRRGEQGLEVRHRPVLRIDASVIGDVVAGVGEGRRHDRHEPEGVHAQRLQGVEPRREPREVADSVTVRVLKRAHVDLVEHGVPVPFRPGEQARGLGGAVLLRVDGLGGRGGRRARRRCEGEDHGREGSAPDCVRVEGTLRDAAPRLASGWLGPRAHELHAPFERLDQRCASPAAPCEA
jgi:hypothetical protein